MKIVLLGSGNIANWLGKRCRESGHEIVQIFSRNSHTASMLAYELNCESTNYISMLDQTADAYIVCVSDDSIAELVSQFQVGKALLLHTAGSVSKDVLSVASTRYGVLYPLQTINASTKKGDKIPFFIDGNTDEVKQAILQLGNSLVIKELVAANDEQRMKLHMAAVISNNFITFLFIQLQKFCAEENISFSALIPLLDTTFLPLQAVNPTFLQTGPASRQDEGTLAKHRELLAKYPALLKIYKAFSDGIQAEAKAHSV